MRLDADKIEESITSFIGKFMSTIRRASNDLNAAEDHIANLESENKRWAEAYDRTKHELELAQQQVASINDELLTRREEGIKLATERDDARARLQTVVAQVAAFDTLAQEVLRSAGHANLSPDPNIPAPRPENVQLAIENIKRKLLDEIPIKSGNRLFERQSVPDFLTQERGK